MHIYNEFEGTIKENPVDLDIMLEIKDKEKSALMALKLIKSYGYLTEKIKLLFLSNDYDDLNYYTG